jgi:recombination protein RecT
MKNFKINNMSNQTTAVTLKSMLGNENVKARFHEILGKKAPGFISSILSVANSNTLLQKAEPKTVMNSAVIAATLDLPINPNLGFAYIVPFGGQAQFQLGYKGFVQLSMRIGQYKTINVREVYEGEIVSENKFTGEYEFGEKTSNNVVGYMSYFKLVNGFEKFLYMSKAELEAHGKKYSQTYKRGGGLWASDFDSMAKKTCLKQLLSKYGILSIEMQRAQTFDQAVVKNDLISENVDEADIEYVDNNPEEARRQAMKEAMQEAEVVDTETGELFK